MHGHAKQENKSNQHNTCPNSLPQTTGTASCERNCVIRGPGRCTKQASTHTTMHKYAGLFVDRGSGSSRRARSHVLKTRFARLLLCYSCSNALPASFGCVPHELLADGDAAHPHYYALHPEQLILFDIPWKLNLSHVLGVTANTNKSTSSPDEYNIIHTVVARGDVSFTKRWKIAANINFDLKEFDITNAFFTLSRDMHCWALSFYWTPIGTNQSFLLSIKNKSTILSDAKLEFRKPPAFL